MRIVIGNTGDTGRVRKANGDRGRSSMRMGSASERRGARRRRKRAREQQALGVGRAESGMESSGKFIEDLDQILGQS